MSFSLSFHEVAAKAVEALASLRVDWMLIGAIPVAAWGQPRATTDADFASSLDFLDSEDLDRAMVSRGFQKVQGPIEITQKRLVLSKYWEPKVSIGIDVFYTTGYVTGEFQRKALERKKSVTFDDRSYPVASAEDLILYKVLAYRMKDLDDVGTVLENRFRSLDWKHIRDWSERLGILVLMKDVVTQYLQERGWPVTMPWGE